jgi:hypothetical protein
LAAAAGACVDSAVGGTDVGAGVGGTCVGAWVGATVVGTCVGAAVGTGVGAPQADNTSDAITSTILMIYNLRLSILLSLFLLLC